jgi:hypothetical protein
MTRTADKARVTDSVRVDSVSDSAGSLRVGTLETRDGVVVVRRVLTSLVDLVSEVHEATR